jgi:hypothetical protein
VLDRDAGQGGRGGATINDHVGEHL